MARPETVQRRLFSRHDPRLYRGGSLVGTTRDCTETCSLVGTTQDSTKAGSLVGTTTPDGIVAGPLVGTHRRLYRGRIFSRRHLRLSSTEADSLVGEDSRLYSVQHRQKLDPQSSRIILLLYMLLRQCTTNVCVIGLGIRSSVF